MSDFVTILESRREEDVQQYLMDHPEILLAAFGSHWEVNELLPKFRFGAEYVTDFVIVTGQSFSYDITLIELEPPTERPFTKAGKYARRLNDALGQVNDWLVWIHDNEAYFRTSLALAMKSSYGRSQITRAKSALSFPDDARHRDFIRAKILIGRRQMLSDEDNKRRAALLFQTQKGIEVVPYDRLLELQARIERVPRRGEGT